MSEILTSKRVTEIFTDCLFKEGEDTSAFVPAQGIVINAGFHPHRIVSYKKEVKKMLNELPDGFKSNDGGGMSFLEACKDKDGFQWTGEHQVMEQLFLLGIALELVSSPIPKELWMGLPGGVPYYCVKSSRLK